MSPDDDWALGQNEVDVRNEARRPLDAAPYVFMCVSPEETWIEDCRAEATLEEASPTEGTEA